MKQIMLLLTILGFSVGAPAWAGSLTVPNTFVGGQKALASEVNKNFEDVETEVTDNADNISSNANSITQNAAGIASNANSITHNVGDIASNANSITLNAGDIASSAVSISDLKTNKLNALVCSDGQVLKYNAGTGNYECADDNDTIPTDADTLDGLDSSDFIDTSSLGAYLDKILPGVMYITFARNGSEWQGGYGTPSTDYLNVNIPFACYIHQVDFKVSTYDGGPPPIEDVVFSVGGYSVAASAGLNTVEVISSTTGNVFFDPAAGPQYLTISNPTGSGTNGGIYWIKIYYSLP